MPFDIARIEAAVTRAAREVACDDPDMPGTVAKAVADALGRGIAPVEDIQDCVEARLGEAGLDDVAVFTSSTGSGAPSCGRLRPCSACGTS